jgi:hypothetical protein
MPDVIMQETRPATHARRGHQLNGDYTNDTAPAAEPPLRGTRLCRHAAKRRA